MDGHRQLERMTARFRQAILLVRDIPTSARFYGPEGLGLKTRVVTEKFAVLNGMDDGPALTLQAVEREADCSTGYSPLLHFEVDDMDMLIQRLMMLGGHLDGPIKYPVEGKVASVRSPDGHMLGLIEPNNLDK